MPLYVKFCTVLVMNKVEGHLHDLIFKKNLIVNFRISLLIHEETFLPHKGEHLRD